MGRVAGSLFPRTREHTFFATWAQNDACEEGMGSRSKGGIFAGRGGGSAGAGRSWWLCRWWDYINIMSHPHAYGGYIELLLQHKCTHKINVVMADTNFHAVPHTLSLQPSVCTMAAKLFTILLYVHAKTCVTVFVSPVKSK